MPEHFDKKYDAIIIGAGIGGLVCGCYLAKGGMRVLIVEKNDKPGGCCSSFTKNGFTFDAAAHSLGGMRAANPIGKIFKELNVSRASLKRMDPSFILKANDYSLTIWNSSDKTLRELQGHFPQEKTGLQKLFDFIENSPANAMAGLYNLTFSDFLNQFIGGRRLKSILATPLLGNTGVDPFKIAAFTAIKFYKQYVFDGGYYFRRGMQEIPDLLMKKFQALGGEICLSSLVSKIIVYDGMACGIYINKDGISARHVISNVDSRQTFLNLVGERYQPKVIRRKLLALKPSGSLYAVYIGLTHELDCCWEAGVTHWFLDNLPTKTIYQKVNEPKEAMDWIAIRIRADRKEVQAFTIAPYINPKYWEKNRRVWAEALIRKAERHIPNLTKRIAFKDSATPHSIYQRTLNYNGATCGWASTPSQLAVPDLSQTTFIKNLYLTGHWSTLTFGLPGVAGMGASTARLILRKEGIS